MAGGPSSRRSSRRDSTFFLFRVDSSTFDADNGDDLPGMGGGGCMAVSHAKLADAFSSMMGGGALPGGMDGFSGSWVLLGTIAYFGGFLAAAGLLFLAWQIRRNEIDDRWPPIVLAGVGLLGVVALLYVFKKPDLHSQGSADLGISYAAFAYFGGLLLAGATAWARP